VGTQFKAQGSRGVLLAMIMLLVLVGNASPASAETQSAQGQNSAPVISSAELKLWPEYDDPGVLVIFSGQFADGTTFPLKATFPVPAAARNIQATYQDASGSLINRPFDVKDGKLTYELPSAGFHLEYYVDRAPTGEQRDVAYDFEAPYPVDALSVSVQQPARSSGFTLTPASENTQTGNDGLTYYVFNRRNLAAGEKLGLNIKYTKADTGLSAPQLAVAPTGAVAQPAGAANPTTAPTAATGSTNLLPWLLIGLGLALLAGVLAYWLLSQRRTSPAAAGPATRPRPATAAQATVRPPVRAQATGDAVTFCTNCGHALKPEDRFCSQCGAPRRA
jgi:hypothetical protein